MKTKIIKTILPTIFGLLTVLFLLLIYNFIVFKGDVFNKPEDGLFTFFVPFVTIIAILIQFFLTLPIWKKFKSNKKVIKLTLIQFTGLLCIVSGLVFGLVFWDPSFGIIDLIWGLLTGIIAFTVFWTINLLTLKKLDKILL